MKRIYSLILLIAIFGSISSFSDEHLESSNYILLKGHFTSAGGTTSSSNYKVISALGQISPVGSGQSASFKLYSGVFTPMFASYNSIPSITSLTALPQADFGASVFPYTVNFYVTVFDVDSSIFDYTWDFGDGQTLNNDNQGATLTITHQFSQAKSTGPYQVTCTVSDKLSSTYEMIDIYLGPQAPKVTIEAHPQYGSRPLTVTFTGTATDPDNGTVTNYEWDFGDGSAHESGATLTSVTHTYSAVVTATTLYTVTLSATDNDARVGTATQTISYIPSLFFDDFEDGDASDWTQYQYTDWTVASNVTNMLKTASDNTARHITAPIPGGLISYGTIRVDMYLPSTSTTELKTGMIIWAFNNYQDYRYLRVDRTAQKVYFGLRAPGDIDKAEFAASGWSIPVNLVFNVELIFRPDGVAVAKINNTTVGSYDYLEAKNGAVGLGTRKSETYFDNFLVSQYADTNLPPIVTIDPTIFVASIYPATVNFTVSATDPDGEDSDLIYFWNFGEGNTSNNKNTSNSYFSEGLFVATLYVTDSGNGVYEPETTTAYSFVNSGVDFYDNFNDGDFSDWTVGETGAWSIVNGELTTSADDINHKIYAPYPPSGDFGYGMACTKFNIQPKTTNTKQNAMMIIGYRDLHMEYRFVKFDNDTNSITINHDDDTMVEQTDASSMHTIPLGTDIFACVKVEAEGPSYDKVTVYYDGKQVLTYTYGTHWSGTWGLRAGKSKTKFDDYIIYDPETSNSTAPDIDTNFRDIDMGDVRTDSPTGQTAQLIIYNKAPLPLGENLNVTNFVFNNSDFTVEDPATSLPITSLAPILAGGQATVQIRYKPAVIEDDAGQLKIYSDDPDETQYIVNFQGEGVKSLKPIATINITPSSGVGPIPLVVNFSASATDPDGDDNLITYQWTFGDGSSPNNNKTCTHTYLTLGEYTATLVLTDDEGQTNSYTKTLKAEYYYFLDTFNDSDISNWTPRNITSWTTYNDNGEIRLRGKNLGAQDDLIAPAAANFTDTAIVEFDEFIASSADGNNVMIIFDYKDSYNHSLIQFKPYSGIWYLRKVVNGVNTNLQSGVYFVNNIQWNHYKAEFVNGVISLSINDQSIVTGLNYGTFSSGRNGLTIQNTNALFDNYKVTFTNMTSINQPPTLAISADPTSGYSPQEITFTASADDPDGNNAFLTYQWNFGDNSGTSSAQNPIYTYTATGTFTATCTVTDSGFPAMSTSQTITIDIVEGNHPPNVTIQGNPTSGKPPLNVSFTSTVTDDENNTPFTYSWNFGDGTPVSSETNPTHTYAITGQYTATLTVTDSGVPPRSGKATIPIDVSNWLTIFEDNFNDNNYTGWTPDVASLWFMHQIGAGEYALNGQYSKTTINLAPATAELKEGNTVEYDFNVRSGQAVVKLVMGLVFDYKNNQNYSLIWINGYTPTIQLQKIINGTTSIVHTGTLSSLNYDTWYHFKAILRDNALTVEINGVKAINAYNYGTVVATRVGLYVSNSSVLFDNFIIKRDASLDGNTAPQVTISANTLEGSAPIEITFTSTVTDNENDIPFTYVWNFGDGTLTSAEENPIHNYTTTGLFTATCSVTDSGDPQMTGSDNLTIDISNYITVFSDNFNDNNYTGWTPDVASLWLMYLRSTGDYALNGQYSRTTIILAPTTAELKEGNTVEYDFNFRSGQVVVKLVMGFVFDYQNNSNYSLIWINGYTSTIQLQKIINGTASIIHTGTLSLLNYNTWYHFKTILRDNALTVEINGVKAINAYNYGTVVATRIGLYVSNSSVLFDNFIVKRDASLDGNTPPQVTISANPLEGSAPIAITFTSTVTDIENDIPFTYVWTFGDGTPTSAEENPVHNYTATGLFTATCSVTDSGDPQMTGSDDLTIDISNYSTIFSDNFNDGDISDWNNLSGTIWSLYQVAANSYRLAGATAFTGTILAPAASEFNNGNIIEFDFLFRSGQVANKKKFGFYYDYQSSTTYTLVRFNYELNTFDVYKYVNGAGSLLFSGTLTSVSFDTWYHFKASMTSGHLTIYINGTKVINNFSYGAVTSNTNGLWIWGSSMFFDDFIAKGIVP